MGGQVSQKLILNKNGGGGPDSSLKDDFIYDMPLICIINRPSVAAAVLYIPL